MENMSIKKKAFTLAEVLITLAIIGVVAALTIPSVVANTQQQEFKTGLRKAVSVLNSAITMNMAIDGQSPYDNADIYQYLQRHMSVMKGSVTTQAGLYQQHAGTTNQSYTSSNLAFYTTDGMRFECRMTRNPIYLKENPTIKLRGCTDKSWATDGKGAVLSTSEAGDCTGKKCGYCGSYGLANNTDNTTNAPCYIVVDVNGDRKPFPKNASCYNSTCGLTNIMKFSDPAGKKLTDIFPIMITDKAAIPYGTAAQKAMYEAQK